jgi:hypothetical protein
VPKWVTAFTGVRQLFEFTTATILIFPFASKIGVVRSCQPWVPCDARNAGSSVLLLYRRPPSFLAAIAPAPGGNPNRAVANQGTWSEKLDHLRVCEDPRSCHRKSGPWQSSSLMSIRLSPLTFHPLSCSSILQPIFNPAEPPIVDSSLESCRLQL